MKLVYIAGPFRAPTPWQVEENVREAERMALEVAKLGCVPVCPHAMYRHYDGSLPDAFWLSATMDLLRHCDMILMLPRWRESVGAKAEFTEAGHLGIDTYTSLERLRAHVLGEP